MRTMIFCGNLENCYFPGKSCSQEEKMLGQVVPGETVLKSSTEKCHHHVEHPIMMIMYSPIKQLITFSQICLLANMTTSLPLLSNGTIFMSCPNWNHISQYPIKISLAHALNTMMNAIIFMIWNHFDKLHNVPEWTYKRQSLTFLTSIFGFLESMLKLGWDILSDSLME